MSVLGVSVDPEKVEAVMSWKRPISRTYDEIDPKGGQV